MIIAAASFLLLLPASVQDAALDEHLRAAPPGLCIVVGAGDGTLVSKIVAGRKWLVHAVDADEDRVRALRRTLESRGQSGLATVEFWSGATLPYEGNLANLVLASTPLPEAELKRILAPGGLGLTARNGAWSPIRKSRPGDTDEWTHWRHGADGNMVSHDQTVALPTGLRWVAGPAQDAGGRKWYYDHMLVSANGRNFYDYEDSIDARDAYNGVLLWSRAIKGHTFKESGLPLPPNPTPKMKLASRTSKVRPVAVGDRLFVASEGRVLALDAATGETAAEYGQARDPRELLVEGGQLLVSDAQAIRAFEPATKRLLWESALAARRMVVDGDALIVVTATHVVALDRATGKERWKKEDPDAALALTCTAHDGTFVLEKSTLRDDPIGCGIKVYSTQDGELMWMRDYKPDMSHYREARAYFAQGLLWLMVEKEGLLGLDPKSGSERKHWTTRGKHCATPVATDRFFLAPECEFTDLKDGTETRARMFKSACRLPFIPANGLLYTFPVQCECFPMLRGYMGLTSEKPLELAEGPRLRPGSPTPAASALLKPAEGDWPMYRHDAWRSGNTATALRRTDVVRAWEVSVAPALEGKFAAEWSSNPFSKGPISAAVAAGGMLFVSVPDLHRVVALDAKSGKLLWSFEAGGRIDGPPTIHQDLCLFGAHDGWVYGLRTGDGEPVWRLRAAPRESRILAYGQMESPWPVVASVLVHQDLGYVAAGRHPMSDGGIRVLAFRPRTGEIVWEKVVDNLDAINRWYGGAFPNTKTKFGLDFEPIDMLVRDGDSIAMSRWKFNPADGDFKLALDSLTYAAPGGLQVQRGLWGYGVRQTKQVLPKPPAVFDDKKVTTGINGDAAMILSGGTLITITAKGELRVGDMLIDLKVEPIFDGMISAYGSLYLSTQKGTLLRLE